MVGEVVVANLFLSTMSRLPGFNKAGWWKLWIIVVLLDTLIIVWVTHRKLNAASGMATVGVLAIFCRCLACFFITNVNLQSLNLQSLAVFHLCYLFVLYVHILAAREHKRYMKGRVADDGVLALSAFSVIFTALGSAAMWLIKVDAQTPGSMFDKYFLTVLAAISLIRHCLLDVEMFQRSTSAQFDGDAWPPTWAALGDLRAALAARSVRASWAAGVSLSDTLQHHRWKHSMVIASALLGMGSLTWNIVSGNLSNSSVAFPISAMAAAKTSMFLSFVLVAVSLSSICGDMGCSTPVNDHKLRLTSPVKIFVVALKIITIFAPQAEDFATIKPMDIVCAETGRTFPNACVRRPTSSGVAAEIAVRDLHCDMGGCLDCGFQGFVLNCSKGSSLERPVKVACSNVMAVGLDRDRWGILMDYLVCYKPQGNKRNISYFALVVTTSIAWLVSLLLTFKRACSNTATTQLQSKVARPTCLKLGFYISWIASQGGLLILTTVSVFDELALLPVEKIGSVDVDVAQSFAYAVAVSLGLAMAGGLTNEVARVCEDPARVLSAASSADGLRTGGDPVLFLGGTGICCLVFYGKMGWALAAASYFTIGMFLGVVLIIVGAGFGVMSSEVSWHTRHRPQGLDDSAGPQAAGPTGRLGGLANSAENLLEPA
eukprot:CAMPEP_0172842744 /NCGR_PEP_ID=MMETSP1075-20121228/30954_1 /TAXON_ID=2916 /ORGANISM="Ceratium fusus, Strain PA161109" /LENGTH=657 /DNA_ID=CAMNT_0013686915 /DNA_START=353 /DNA_END=2326 /DNA_ORIENTATION=+